MLFAKSAFCVIITLDLTLSQHVEFFDRQSFQYPLFSAQITTSCATLPSRYWDKAESVKADKCVILYSHTGCVGKEFQLEAGNHSSLPYFFNETDSFRSCVDLSETSLHQDLRAKFYLEKDFKDILLDVPISADCQTLPSWACNKAASIKTEACVLLYSFPFCKGNSFKVEKGEYVELTYFYNNTDSFRACDLNEIRKDYSFTVQIFKVEVTESPNDSPEDQELSLAATQYFRNNGSATIKQKYSVSKEIREIVEMERVVGTSEFRKFSMDSNVNVGFGSRIQFLFQAKISASLNAGYTFTKEKTELLNTKHRQETTRKFSIEQEIHIPPCTVYEISSVVNVMTNYRLSYITHAHVTGEYSGKRVSANEIQSRLTPEMSYVAHRDEYTIEVLFEGNMTADFGLKAEAHANGHRISGCSSDSK